MASLLPFCLPLCYACNKSLPSMYFAPHQFILSPSTLRWASPLCFVWFPCGSCGSFRSLQRFYFHMQTHLKPRKTNSLALLHHQAIGSRFGCCSWLTHLLTTPKTHWLLLSCRGFRPSRTLLLGHWREFLWFFLLFFTLATKFPSSTALGLVCLSMVHSATTNITK